ncbi:hypothetical protein UCREL1_11806 [Eutypa lata UCREL1]|uniref:Uncharacterized protein n=1 Tax=Eutypa lata (strain UCR-EL1) TaxID=1287681 RepID=M7SAT0_EUTLA|nr:hypothetical protein UCREL1_11806 [Eutypa lata UCREL1]
MRLSLPIADEKHVAKKRAPAKKKALAVVGMCSLNKKDFGDRIKNALRLEKYEAQRMFIPMEMDLDFFRHFFGGEIGGLSITPEIYDEETPVVVAQLTHAAAGAVFGVSKVKGGNRFATTHLAKMAVILFPQTKKAQAWLTV